MGRHRKRPLLHGAANQILDTEQQRQWASNWERSPASRRVLWMCTAFWDAMLLLDTAGRVGMALTLPVDLVPLLDDVLLVLVVAVLFGFQRIFSRLELRRAGLRMRGVRITALDPR